MFERGSSDLLARQSSTLRLKLANENQHGLPSAHKSRHRKVQSLFQHIILSFKETQYLAVEAYGITMNHVDF